MTLTSKQKLFGLIALVILTGGICLHVALIKQPLNYQVITAAAENILHGQNPYAPQQGLNFFKYSPLAGLLTVPFSLLWDEIGLFLFVFLQFWLFLWGFWYWSRTAGFRLEKSLSVFLLAFFSIIFDTTVNIQNCQVNAWILGLMLLGAAQYAEGKYIKSGLLLSLASNLKLFPFTLGLCLLTGFKKKYWAAFGGGALFWFVLPAFFLGWKRNLTLLNQWIDLMSWDQTRSLNMLDIGSFLEKHFGLSAWWRNPLAILVGIAVGLGTWMLFHRRKYSLLHRFLLPMGLQHFVDPGPGSGAAFLFRPCACQLESLGQKFPSQDCRLFVSECRFFFPFLQALQEKQHCSENSSRRAFIRLYSSMFLSAYQEIPIGGRILIERSSYVYKIAIAYRVY